MSGGRPNKGAPHRVKKEAADENHCLGNNSVRLESTTAALGMVNRQYEHSYVVYSLPRSRRFLGVVSSSTFAD